MRFSAPAWFRKTDTGLTLGTDPGQVTLVKATNFDTGEDLLPAATFGLDNRGVGQYRLYADNMPERVRTILFTLRLVDDPTIEYEGYWELGAAEAILPNNGAMMWDLREVPTTIDWEADDGVTPLPNDASINIYARDRSHVDSAFLAFYDAGVWTMNPNGDLPRPGFGLLTMEITTTATEVMAGTFSLNGDNYTQVFDVPYTPPSMNDLATHILADGTLVPHQVDAVKKKYLLSQESRYAKAALLTSGRAQCGGWDGLLSLQTGSALPLDFVFNLQAASLFQESGWTTIAHKDVDDATLYIDAAFPTPQMACLYISYSTGPTALAENTYLRAVPQCAYDNSAHSQVVIIPPTPANTTVNAWVLDTGHLKPYRSNTVPPVSTSQGSTPQQILVDFQDPETGKSAFDYMRTIEQRRPGFLFVRTIEFGCSDFVETPPLPLGVGLNAQLWLVPTDGGGPVQIAERGADNGVWTSMPAPSGTHGFLRFNVAAGVTCPATLLEFKVRGNSGSAIFALRIPDNTISTVDGISLFFNADGTPHESDLQALAMTPPASVALAPADVQTIADTVAASVGAEVADGTWATMVPGVFQPGTAGNEMGQLRAITTKFVEAIGKLLSHTYNAGEVQSPFAAMPAPTVPMYYKTNYAGTTTVGEAWGAILATPGIKVFYTTKLRSEDKTPTIDAECAILDPVKGTIQIALTKEQLTVKTGEYFSQLQARTYTADPTPLVDQIWVMQEGKQLVKPTFKG